MADGGIEASSIGERYGPRGHGPYLRMDNQSTYIALFVLTTSRCFLRYVCMDQKELNNILFPKRQNRRHASVGAATDIEIYFVTVCTKGRIPNIANNPVHTVLRRIWIDTRFWFVHAYVIMPDHIHLLVAKASRDSVALRNWVGWWMRQCVLENPKLCIAWQKGCFDTRIRNEAMFAQKWEYIRDNPVRRGLVGRACDWPFMDNLNRRW